MTKTPKPSAAAVGSSVASPGASPVALPSFDPHGPLYDAPTALKVKWAGRIGVALTFLTIAATVGIFCSPSMDPAWRQPLLLGLAASWGIGGPMWFFWEYFFYYREHGTAGSWEQFKHGQQISATVWIALTTGLALFGTSDLVKTADGAYRCEIDIAATAAVSGNSPGKMVLLCAPKK